MKVLVACEESQEVCKAFRAKGHEAFSCDLQDCSGGHPEWHIKEDAIAAILYEKWDLIIMHPPCTKICCTGNRTYGNNKLRNSERIEAAKWTYELWNLATSNCDKVCMENPKGVLNSLHPELPKPQYIQPYQYGHRDSKLTGLWLYNLPKLISTYLVTPEWIYPKNGGNRMSKTHALNPSTNNPENAKLRSKTYPGIAKAMAEQWG